ncbi:LysR family transcriptional regulator [Oceanospirillum beijerinckii]|uniref:LysR family transcriptional regulator n=1 Tax=Oceanospirillum beijerinckii TaxID=64976 RepID=UPI00041F3D02|nr:LysR family transcriptional regulator [Oceanospirillum beijerinckii]
MWRYDDIAIVVAVAEQGSFSAAAEQLAMPPSTLSRRVSALENQLGLRLLERNTRSLKLTQKGNELVAGCAEQVKSMQQTVSHLTSDNDSAAGVLNVSAPLTLGNDLMSQCFSDFVQCYPLIRLQLDLSNDLRELFKDHTDVALRVGPLKDSELIAKKLFSTEMVLCASPIFIQQQAIDLENIHSLDQCPFLTYLDAESTLTARHRAGQTEYKLRLLGTFSSNNTQALKTACIHGLGLACLPQISVQRALNSRELIRLFDSYLFDDAKQIYAVYPSKKHLPQKVRVFIEHIQQQYERKSSLF